jgi:hypothetical protein
MRRRLAWIEVVALGAAVAVAVAVGAQAVREHSLEPIWTVGWIPAVLVGAVGPRQSARRCLGRLHRRSLS